MPDLAAAAGSLPAASRSGAGGTRRPPAGTGARPTRGPRRPGNPRRPVARGGRACARLPSALVLVTAGPPREAARISGPVRRTPRASRATPPVIPLRPGLGPPAPHATQPPAGPPQRARRPAGGRPGTGGARRRPRSRKVSFPRGPSRAPVRPRLRAGSCRARARRGGGGNPARGRRLRDRRGPGGGGACQRRSRAPAGPDHGRSAHRRRRTRRAPAAGDDVRKGLESAAPSG